MSRPGAIAVVAVVSALLGGTLALAFGKAVGWVDDDGSRIETVLVQPQDDATPAADRVEGSAAKPLVGNGFDASELYRKRAAGVVTIYALFGDSPDDADAEIVGWDVFDDVGVLKVDPADHPVSPVPLGDSSGVVVGEPVAAIGSPFGQVSSLSVGVVSATERSI